MFIKLGSKRINLSLVKEYRPFTKSTVTGEYYSVELVFLNDTKEEIHFFKKDDEMHEFLKMLDDNLLNKTL